MMSTANAKPTLESIVTRYRREVSRNDGSSPELEVRIQDVDYANFAAIYGALHAKKGGDGRPVAVGDGVLTQMVSAIMDVRAAGRAEGPQRHLRPMRIREIFFEGGQRVREQFVRKTPLLIPFRVPSATGLAYTVALSAERPDDQGFSSDESAVIRAKARMSFHLKLESASEMRPLRWRVDMTVTRQIMGSDAGASLKQIVAQMFATAPPMSPATFLAALRLDDDANPAPRQLYRYEVEAEFADPAELRDLIRPADVTAAAEAILRLANPEYVREAAMQAEVYRVAQYIVKAPGYLRRFQHELGLKRMLPSALAITRADYRGLYPPKGLYLTEKADGKRALAVVHDGRGIIISDSLLDGFEPRAGVRADDPLYASDTILDGELVERAARDQSGSLGVDFYAFDVVAVAGEDVTPDGFAVRLGRLAEAVEIMRQMGLPVSAKGYTRLSSDRPAELAREIRGVYEAERPYEIDGLIFVEPGKPFGETVTYKWKPPEHNTIDVLARRAPASVLGKEPFIDRPGHKLHFLFVGINPDLYDGLGLQWCPGYADLFGDEPRRGRGARGQADGSGANTGSYFPIQFSPSDVPLAYVYQHPDASPLGAEIDGAVIEVRCAEGGSKGGCIAAGGSGATLVNWEATRRREDRRRELAAGRYYGNDFYTAELIWLNYVDPFPFEQLWEGTSSDYFMRPKSGIYRAQTAATSFVKSQRIATLKHAGWVVDVGAGKGQDLHHYLDAEVQHLIAVDQDRGALSELVRRKYNFARGTAPGAAPGAAYKPEDNKNHGAGWPFRRRGRDGKAYTATTIHVLVADANDPFGETLDKLEALGLGRMVADALVCNLSVHYFLADLPAMRNFIALARGVVKVGGQVILTILFGEAVHAAFTTGRVALGETWDIFEAAGAAPPTRKYSLKRLYSGETLEGAGQRIGVLLPFSEGRYYEEFLVNTKVLTAEFAARGFRLTARTSVAKSIPDFAARHRALAGLLTEGDRKWLGLYGELVYQRDK
jgi:hypothetical protein